MVDLFDLDVYCNFHKNNCIFVFPHCCMLYAGIKGTIGPPGLPGSKELCQSLPGPEGPPGTDGYPGHPGQIIKLCNII